MLFWWLWYDLSNGKGEKKVSLYIKIEFFRLIASACMLNLHRNWFKKWVPLIFMYQNVIVMVNFLSYNSIWACHGALTHMEGRFKALGQVVGHPTVKILSLVRWHRVLNIVRLGKILTFLAINLLFQARTRLERLSSMHLQKPLSWYRMPSKSCLSNGLCGMFPHILCPCAKMYSKCLPPRRAPRKNRHKTSSRMRWKTRKTLPPRMVLPHVWNGRYWILLSWNR